jgi:SAM-dependent methyltransferase
VTQREIWDDVVGESWVRNAALIDAHSAPFGEAAMDVLGALDGRTVLDVGCGTGSTTRALAQRGARAVVGCDLSERMIEVARRDARDLGERVRFEAGDVLDLSLATPFDAVYSRFGVMFFDDPVRAFSHLGALTGSGGTLAFCSWRGPFDNPWMSVPVMASVPLLGMPAMPGPGEPGPFSLAEPDAVAELLAAAGWSDVAIEERTTNVPHAAGDAGSVAAMAIETIPPLAEGLLRRPELREPLQEAVAEALAAHEVDGRVVLPAAALVVSARRASAGSAP